MKNVEREPAKENDLFFTCSLIDYIARNTKNTRAMHQEKRILRKFMIQQIFIIVTIQSVERVRDDFIRETKIKTGNFDNVGTCTYAIPSHWNIGKVYKRLIKAVAEYEKIEVIDALLKVYNSFISNKIDDYNSSMYYENPSYLLECYLENKVL